MATVRARDFVLIGEVHAHPGSGCLFARIQVHKARNAALGVLNVDALFKFADGLHAPVGFEQVFS